MRIRWLAASLLASALVASPASAQNIVGLEERLDRLLDLRQGLLAELERLAELAPVKSRHQTPLIEREAYVEEVLALRAELGELQADVDLIRDYLTPPRLKVTGAVEPRFGATVDDQSRTDSAWSVEVSGLPNELVPDRPYSVRFDLRRRVRHRSGALDDMLSRRVRPPGMEPIRARIELGPWMVEVMSEASDCTSGGGDGDFWGDLQVTLELIPERRELRGRDMYYLYRVEVETDALIERSQLAGPAALVVWRPWLVPDAGGFFDPYTARSRPEGWLPLDDSFYLNTHEGLEVAFPGNRLVYRPVTVGGSDLTPLTTHRHPEQLARKPPSCVNGALASALVPDVTGMAQEDAIQKLLESGLGSRVGAAGAAPRFALENKVARQEPPRGTRIERGGIVRVDVFGPVREETLPSTATVPDLERMTLEEAIAELESQGLSLTPSSAGPAPSSFLALTVDRQEPPAETRVERGSAVKVWIYGRFAPTGVTVPRLDGLSALEARDALQRLGLEISPVAAGAPPTSNQSFKVGRHDPPAGSLVKRGTSVKVWIFGRHPSLRPPPPPPPPPSNRCSGGAEPRYKRNGELKGCYCPNNQYWSKRRSRCRPILGGGRTREEPDPRVKRCSSLIFQIKMHAATAAIPDSPNANLSRLLVQQLATQARNLGCDREQIDTALGEGGGGGSSDGNSCRCPSGYDPAWDGNGCLINPDHPEYGETDRDRVDCL